MLERQLLNLNECRQIYEWHLVNHFPADEVKPFYIIEKCLEEGSYLPYGFYEEGRLVAYAYMLKKGSYFLLDYLAVLEEIRGQGKGSEILSIIKKELGEKETVFIEAECPDPHEPEIRETQVRRIRFYLRNGAKEAGLMWSAFGVPYRVLVLGKPLESERAKEGMEQLYHSMLSDEMYEKNVFFKLDSQK